MFIFVCLVLYLFKVFYFDGMVIEFDNLMDLKDKFCFCIGFNRNVLYVSCLFLIYKFKIRYRNKNLIVVIYLVEFDVKENFDVFCVDEE